MYVIAMLVGVVILVAMMVFTSTRFGKQYENNHMFNGAAVTLALATAASALMVMWTIELPVLHC